MKQPFKRYIKVFISILIALALVDIAVGYMGDLAIKNMKDQTSFHGRNTYRLNQVESDVVIVGSSRALHHYITPLLTEKIQVHTNSNVSVYNAGLDGSMLTANCCVIESILSRYTPQIIILEATDKDFYGLYKQENMEELALHYRTNPVVRKYIQEMDWKTRIMCSSNMFRYNQKLLPIFQALKSPIVSNHMGYDPLNGIKTETVEENCTRFENCTEIDTAIIHNLENIILLSKQRDITLIIATSPYFNPSDSNTLLSKLCQKYDIPYIDTYSTPYFDQKPSLFHDSAHLNDSGAKVYTDLFFDKIKEFL